MHNGGTPHADNNEQQVISSLQSHIRALRAQLEESHMKCEDLEQRLERNLKAADIYKESQIKYDRKCSEYETLSEHYDGVKVELLSAKQAASSLQERIQEMQTQRDQSIAAQKQMERQHLEFEREIKALQHLRDTFDQQTFEQIREVEALQEQLTSLQRDKVEQDLDEMNQYTDDIRKLNQKVHELTVENEELRRSRLSISSASVSTTTTTKSRHSPPIPEGQHPLLYDRDSFDENDSDHSGQKDRSRSRSKTGSDHSGHSGSAHSTSSGHNGITNRLQLNGRVKTHYFSAEEMDIISAPSPHDGANGLKTWTESIDSNVLWHDVDLEVIKIETLLAVSDRRSMRSESDKSMLSPQRPCIVDLDQNEEKALEICYGINMKLTQRLQYVYNEVMLIQQKLESQETRNNDMVTMMALKDIKIRSLQNKVTEIKSQKESLKYDYSNLQSLFEGYRTRTRSYLKQYQNNVDAMHRTLSRRMDEVGNVRSWRRQLRRWRYCIFIFVLLFLVTISYRIQCKLRFPVLKRIRIFLGL